MELRLAEVEYEKESREQTIERLTERLAERDRRLTGLDRELARQRRKTAEAEWRLESVKGRRWWRLGEALSAARRGPVALAGGLRAALRSTAPPAPPAQIEPPPAEPAAPLVEPAPASPLPDGPIARPELTAAVVLAPATAAVLRYEWRQLDGFGPDDWREKFETDPPDLLFVESVDTDLPLAELVDWCRERGIPTAFWDTGGPAGAAGLFDRVFATGAAAADRHRGALGADRVGELPFAAQPRLHHPIRVPDHGRYPVAFEGDTAAAEHMLPTAGKFGVHLRDPAAEPPLENLLTARKQYRVTLHAGDPRRAYELAAAGVPLVHAHETPPGLGPVVTDPEDTKAVLRALLFGPELRDRQAHLALREIHAGHTYGHRVTAVLDAFGRPDPAPARPAVSMLLPTCRPGQLAQAIEQAARQVWRPLQLVLILHGLDLDPAVVEEKARAAGVDDVVVLALDRSHSLGACLNLGIEAADGDLIGKMDDDELYGPHYVSDLIAAFSYTEADVVGKLAHYAYLESIGATLLRWPDHEHRYVRFLRGGALLARGGLLREYRFADLGQGEDTDLFRRLYEDGVLAYATDRFSFMTIRYSDPSRHTWRPADRQLMANARLFSYGMPEEHILY
ncbi:family 2 glycosyl transferase [Actinomadura craniellae]|uniref:Family 2 glycosyl transferase n=1 Tax=Actinomadura craniellae TaxID=2231787 RepID=A0A365GVU5_9ACTN|nr:family 2 glycosyl transferase [Actinomadura craniellae]